MVLYTELLNYFPPIYNIGTNDPIAETNHTYSSYSNTIFPLEETKINDADMLYQLQIVRNELIHTNMEEELLFKLKTLINNWGPKKSENLGLNIINEKTIQFIKNLINQIEADINYRDKVINYAESLNLEHNLKLNGTKVSVEQLSNILEKTKMKSSIKEQNVDLLNLINSLKLN